MGPPGVPGTFGPCVVVILGCLLLVQESKAAEETSTMRSAKRKHATVTSGKMFATFEDLVTLLVVSMEVRRLSGGVATTGALEGVAKGVLLEECSGSVVEEVVCRKVGVASTPSSTPRPITAAATARPGSIGGVVVVVWACSTGVVVIVCSFVECVVEMGVDGGVTFCFLSEDVVTPWT